MPGTGPGRAEKTGPGQKRPGRQRERIMTGHRALIAIRGNEVAWRFDRTAEALTHIERATGCRADIVVMVQGGHESVF